MGVPRCLARAEDALGPLIPLFETLQREAPGSNHIIPDVNICKVGRRGELTEQCTWYYHKKMPESKMLELMRGMLIHAGAPVEIALPMSYNTLRRFLPTVGEVSGFLPLEL